MQLFPKRPRAFLEPELRFGHHGVEVRELLVLLLLLVLFLLLLVCYIVYVVYVVAGIDRGRFLAVGVLVDDATLLSVVVVRCDAADHAHPGASVFGELVDADHLPIDAARFDGSDEPGD